MNTLTKTELIDRLATKLETTKKFAGDAVNTLIEAITEAIKSDKKLVIPGFGTWGAKDRAARTGRNPQTGAPLKIAAARVPYFKAGSVLKEAVRRKGAQAKGKK